MPISDGKGNSIRLWLCLLVMSKDERSHIILCNLVCTYIYIRMLVIQKIFGRYIVLSITKSGSLS